MTLNDTNRFLYASIREVIWSLAIAVILVVLVVYLFLQDIRATIPSQCRQLQLARKRMANDHRQINILKEAVRKTELLMRHSSNTTYLEVLTAQQSLLEAENTFAQDRFDEIQGIIRLYHALGGGL